MAKEVENGRILRAFRRLKPGFAIIACSPLALWAAISVRPPVASLWQDRGNTASLDLFHGSASEANAPKPPFIFEKEDRDGTNPKFTVRDAAGVKWKVKLGEEAGAETVASRFVWAAGYYTDDDYYLPVLRASNMPRLHRGQRLVSLDGSVFGVRLKRVEKGGGKEDRWKWKSSPFRGTREFNGLRVVMALVNNWDLKDENNAVRRIEGRDVYLVSDLGASFGSAGRGLTREGSKSNLASYRRSKFIARERRGVVDFGAPGRPSFVHLVEPREYIARVHLEWIGRDIPVEDARWIGRRLANLTNAQIESAFRAGGYSPYAVGQYSRIFENRIRQLSQL